MILRISSGKQRNLFSPPRSSKTRLFPWFIPLLAVSLWLGYKPIQSHLAQPEAVLVLGGAEEREHFAAKFARQNPQLRVWVSSGSPEGYAKRVFTKHGIEPHRLHLDYRAMDTVTNFTTLVDDLEAEGIDCVYLVTSDDHMRRARVIGEIVLGSRKIVIKPLPVASGRSPEPIEKALRDGARAVLWVTTGHTGATLAKIAPNLK